MYTDTSSMKGVPNKGGQILLLGKNIATMNLSTLSKFLVIYRLNVSIHYLEVKYMWRAKEIHKKKKMKKFQRVCSIGF